MKNLESKVTELRTELESKDVQMQGKVTELEAKVQELVREKKQRNAAADYSKFAKKKSIRKCHQWASFFMRGSQDDWAHLGRILFRHGIGDDGICLL